VAALAEPHQVKPNESENSTLNISPFAKRRDRIGNDVQEEIDISSAPRLLGVEWPPPAAWPPRAQPAPDRHISAISPITSANVGKTPLTSK